MRYLGGLRGAGTLRCKGQDVAPADYALDGYLIPPAGVAGSGEIRSTEGVVVRAPAIDHRSRSAGGLFGVELDRPLAIR